ncbi:hypothetical protein FRB90_002667, partial [Tulasnella sp. 427]
MGPDTTEVYAPPPPSSSSGWVHKLNMRVADSAVGRYFRLEGSGHPKTRAGSVFTTELRAGLTTFAA